jgi:hypothetical protein
VPPEAFYIAMLALSISFIFKKYLNIKFKKFTLYAFLFISILLYTWKSLLLLFIFYASNRFTRSYLISIKCDYYGLNEKEAAEEISSSNTAWSDAWTRFWVGFFQNISKGGSARSESSVISSENQQKRRRPVEQLHKNVGFCQGSDVTTTTKFTHPLYRCGNCGHAGCAQMNCTNRSFMGTRCSMCSKDMNFGR